MSDTDLQSLSESYELEKKEDWTKMGNFKLYALHPAVLSRYRHGDMLYTKTEREEMKKTLKRYSLRFPSPNHAFDTPDYPPKIIPKVPVEKEIEDDLDKLNYEEVAEKYQTVANAPANPFAEKRLMSKLPCSWECDMTKDEDDSKIYSTLHHVTVVSYDGKQKKPSKFPVLHSDKICTIQPSWYYQPSTYVNYGSLNKNICSYKPVKK